MSGIRIVNGRGNGGHSAGVSPEGRLETSALTKPVELEANNHHESAFTIVDSVTPDSTDSYIVYIKNESDDPLIIEEIILWTQYQERIQMIQNPQGTPTGSDITPVNCNFGSSRRPIGVFKSDSDITGLSSGPIVERFTIQGGEQSSIVYYISNLIVLTRNTTFGLRTEDGNGTIEYTLPFFYLSSLH